VERSKALDDRVYYRLFSGSYTRNLPHPDGTSTLLGKDTYDESGNVIESVDYDTNDEPWRTVRVFDETGRVAKETVYGVNSQKLLWVKKFEYETDSQGNWTLKREFMCFQLGNRCRISSSTTRQIEYYEQ
jgi:hypothetical protein